MNLTDRQSQWLKAHFKNTKNDVIMEKLKISHSALHRFAREHGLRKTKQFQKKCQLNAARLANEVNRRNSWPPKGYRIPRSEEFQFKPGITPKQRLGKRRNAERIRKSAESRRKTVAAEKRAIWFTTTDKVKGGFGSSQ